MNTFALRKAQNDCFTAYHIATNVLIHSSVDPIAEAKAVLKQSESTSGDVLLIGNGLGYVSTELEKAGRLHKVVELFAGLSNLCGDYGTRAADYRCFTADELSSVLTSCPNSVQIVISPYINALRNELDVELRKLVCDLLVTLQSQKVYRPLVDSNIRVNRRHFESLEHFEKLHFDDDKILVAVGSAPSLDASLETLRDYRERIVLAAASGALPILSQYGLNPDFAVAMEARDSVIGDCEFASEGLAIVVFPWTHPAVLSETHFQLLRANETDNIYTGGGSTGIATADIAVRLCAGPLFLVGMDMTDSSGEYSARANRVSANLRLGAPKFSVMRCAATEWVGRIQRTIYHMTMPGTEPILGARKVYPMELRTSFDRELINRAHLHSHYQ